MKVQIIPLSALGVSALNVRPVHDDDDIDSLAADIRAHGLISPLIVHAVEGGFHVAAGGRRLTALARLRDAGELPEDHPVLCQVSDGSDTDLSELSLAENVQRRAMNPADEATAFRHLVLCEGIGAERIAARFGTTVAHVKGRLRLAELHPDVFNALQEGAITLDSAKAYGSTSDAALQAKVFAEQAAQKWGTPHSPGTVRQALQAKTLGFEDLLVKFVGIDAYTAAGGRIEQDIFDLAGGDGQCIDVALVKALAQTKAEGLLTAAVKADGFGSGLFCKDLRPHSGVPAAPEGFKRVWGYQSELPTAKKDLKKLVGVYAATVDGTLERIGDYFRPHTAEEKAAVVAAGGAEADGRPKSSGSAYVQPTPEEREAEQLARDKKWTTQKLCARSLVSFADNPLADRAFYTRDERVSVDEDGGAVWVQVAIRVELADYLAALPAIEEEWDVQLAAKRSVVAFIAALGLEIVPVAEDEPATVEDPEGVTWSRRADGWYSTAAADAEIGEDDESFETLADLRAYIEDAKAGEEEREDA